MGKQLHILDNIKNPLKTAYWVLGITFIVFCGLALIVFKGQKELSLYTDFSNKYSFFAVRMEEFMSNLKDSEISSTGFIEYQDSSYWYTYKNSLVKNDSLLSVISFYQAKEALAASDFQKIKELSQNVLALESQKLNINVTDNSALSKAIKQNFESLSKIVSDLKAYQLKKITHYRYFQEESIRKQPLYLLLIIFTALSIFIVSALFILFLIKKIIRSQQSLAYKIAEIQSINQELDQYTFTLTHHLQEPIRKVRLFLNRFESKEKANNYVNKDIHLLSRAKESAEQAQTYLNEFINYSQLLRQDELHLEKVSLNGILDNILKEYVEEIVLYNAQIHVDNLPTIWGEPHQVHLLWSHLLDNALKYRNPHKRPIISIKYHRESSQNVRFSIRDNGLGFDIIHKDKIFEVFQRLPYTTQPKGLGLGLAICHRIVKAHKGYITVESQEGQGSVFNIYFPITILGEKQKVNSKVE